MIGSRGTVHWDVLQASPVEPSRLVRGGWINPSAELIHICTAWLQIQAESLKRAPEHQAWLCPGGPGTKAIMRRGGSRALSSAYPADYGIICQAWPLCQAIPWPQPRAREEEAQKGQALAAPAGLEFILAPARAFPRLELLGRSCQGWQFCASPDRIGFFFGRDVNFGSLQSPFYPDRAPSSCGQHLHHPFLALKPFLVHAGLATPRTSIFFLLLAQLFPCLSPLGFHQEEGKGVPQTLLEDGRGAGGRAALGAGPFPVPLPPGDIWSVDVSVLGARFSWRGRRCRQQQPWGRSFPLMN